MKNLKELLTAHRATALSLSHLQELEDQCQKRLTEIQTSADPDDAQRIDEMLRLRGQINLAPGRRAILEEQLSRTEADVALEIDNVIPRINAVLGKRHQALLEKTAGLLREVANSEEEGRKVASQTPGVIRAERLAHAWCLGTWNGTPYQRPVEAAQALIAFSDQNKVTREL